jgi:CRP-like cAMP-binding protein
VQNTLEHLKQRLQGIAPIPEEEWAEFSRGLAGRDFGAGENLLRANQVGREYFFIASGLVRMFYTTEDGKEFNKSFIAEGGIAGSLGSVLMGEASRFSIAALEPTSAVVIPAELMERLYGRHPCWERVGRRFAELLALKKERREAAFLLDDAETRYRDFQSEFPDLEQRIPLYHIASYLGITDVALSRIRKRLRSA